jgi:4-hydroxy-2-oxoheptanedioate aldolase
MARETLLTSMYDRSRSKEGDMKSTQGDSGKQILGAWCTIPSSFAVELVALLDLDFVVMDMQHGLISYPDLVGCLQAAERRGKRTVVRVATGEFGIAQRVLDAGALDLIFPMINSIEDARQAVDAAKYPPIGARSYGPIRSRFIVGTDPTVANREVRCLVQIETREAVENLSAILSVPGVDGTYIGPADLALTHGLQLGAQNSQLDEIIEKIRSSTDQVGLMTCIHTTSGASARRYLQQGFSMVSIGSDAIWLRNGYGKQFSEAMNIPHVETLAFY